MFLESILFLQKLKISKTVLPCFDDSVAGHPSRMPQSRARGSILATCSRVEGLVVRVTQRFSRLSSWLPREWDFQSWKTLSKFFQNFWLEVFWQVKLATYLSREKRVFCFLKTVFKIVFQFFPRIFVTVHCLPHFSLSNTSCLTSKSIHFCIISSPIFKKKVWVFSVSLHFSCFECAFLDSVSVLLPLCFEKYHVRIRVCFILVSVLWLRVSVFDCKLIILLLFI